MKSHRLIGFVCIAAILVAGIVPGASDLLGDALVPLGPLFGTVVSVPTPEVDTVDLGAAPFLSIRTSRAPPLA